jgi:hypothetical protein
MKTSIKIMTVFITISMIFALTPMTQMGHAADGTTGSISATNDNYYINSAITVELESLTASGEYALNFTAGCYPGADANNQYVFDLSSSETEKTFTFEDMRAPTADSRVCTIELVYQSAGTLIDSIDLQVKDPAEGLPVAFVLALAVPVIIFLVVIQIVKRFGT